MPIFAVQLRFITEAERRLAVRPAHRTYLAELYERGELVTAGPWTDDSGALLIYDAADEAAVREILAKDPYTAADIYELVDIREWNQVFPIRSMP